MNLLIVWIVEAEMARTQKNKATMGHLGMLKAKLAKLRRELLTPQASAGGGGGEGFDVAKTVSFLLRKSFFSRELIFAF
jgi:ribosome-interacting GTPase 1